MEQHHTPSKQEIRDWMREQVEAHQPPPDPEAIRAQLWPIQERDRRQVAS